MHSNVLWRSDICRYAYVYTVIMPQPSPHHTYCITGSYAHITTAEVEIFRECNLIMMCARALISHARLNHNVMLHYIHLHDWSI